MTVPAQMTARARIATRFMSDPFVDATMAAGLAPHFYACEGRKSGLEVLPDPHRDVLQAWDLETTDFVQILVIEPLAQREAAALDLAQIGDEPGRRIDRSCEHDARDERMAVQPVVGMAFGRAGET